MKKEPVANCDRMPKALTTTRNEGIIEQLYYFSIKRRKCDRMISSPAAMLERLAEGEKHKA